MYLMYRVNVVLQKVRARRHVIAQGTTVLGRPMHRVDMSLQDALEGKLFPTLVALVLGAIAVLGLYVLAQATRLLGHE